MPFSAALLRSVTRKCRDSPNAQKSIFPLLLSLPTSHLAEQSKGKQMRRLGQGSLARRALDMACQYGDQSFAKHLGVNAEVNDAETAQFVARTVVAKVSLARRHSRRRARGTAWR